MEQSAQAHQIRILLVEDHLLTRVGLKAVIERTNDLCVVGEAEDGEQAVRLAEELQPNLVLMDVGLPIMDGIEAAALIKARQPGVEIIMLTSHDDDRDIYASLSSGASGYCLKDVEPERLYIAIRSVSSGDIWLDSAIARKVLALYSRSSIEPTPGPGEAAFAPRARTGDHAELPLSPREMEVLTLLVEGLSNQQIADRLVISLATAKTHVRNILNKLSVDDRTQAAVQAMKRGLV